jgi:hypothetical protein
MITTDADAHATRQATSARHEHVGPRRRAPTTMPIPLFATMTDEEQTYVIESLGEELGAA